MYIEEPWVMTYTFISNNFALLFSCLAVVFLAFLGLATLTLRRAKRSEAERSTIEGGTSVPG